MPKSRTEVSFRVGRSNQSSASRALVLLAARAPYISALLMAERHPARRTVATTQRALMACSHRMTRLPHSLRRTVPTLRIRERLSVSSHVPTNDRRPPLKRTLHPGLQRLSRRYGSMPTWAFSPTRFPRLWSLSRSSRVMQGLGALS